MEAKKKPETLEEALDEIDLLNCRVEYEMSLNKSYTKELVSCKEKLKAIQSIITI